MLKIAIAGVLIAVLLTGFSSANYIIHHRPEITKFPAVVVQPKAQSVIAFDLLPKGKPAEDPDNGFAWQDICDADLIVDPEAPVVCARVGTKSDRIEIGVRTFNGASAKPVHIIYGGQTKLIIDESGVRVLGDLHVTGRINP